MSVHPVKPFGSVMADDITTLNMHDNNSQGSSRSSEAEGAHVDNLSDVVTPRSNDSARSVSSEHSDSVRSASASIKMSDSEGSESDKLIRSWLSCQNQIEQLKAQTAKISSEAKQLLPYIQEHLSQRAEKQIKYEWKEEKEKTIYGRLIGVKLVPGPRTKEMSNSSLAYLLNTMPSLLTQHTVAALSEEVEMEASTIEIIRNAVSSACVNALHDSYQRCPVTQKDVIKPITLAKPRKNSAIYNPPRSDPRHHDSDLPDSAYE